MPVRLGIVTSLCIIVLTFCRLECTCAGLHSVYTALRRRHNAYVRPISCATGACVATVTCFPHGSPGAFTYCLKT